MQQSEKTLLGLFKQKISKQQEKADGELVAEYYSCFQGFVKISAELAQAARDLLTQNRPSLMAKLTQRAWMLANSDEIETKLDSLKDTEPVKYQEWCDWLTINRPEIANQLLGCNINIHNNVS